mgnify:CR=1 FL=1
MAEVVAVHLLPAARRSLPARQQLVRYDGFEPIDRSWTTWSAWRRSISAIRGRRACCLRGGAAIRCGRSLCTALAPPASGADDPRDLWRAGENCAFADVPELPVPRLGALRAGRRRRCRSTRRWLARSALRCPDGAAPGAVRTPISCASARVRVRLRVQVAVAAMRGPAGRLFAKGGTAASAELFAPDQQIVLDVTPPQPGAARHDGESDAFSLAEQ